MLIYIINQLNLSEYFSDEKIIKKLFNYLDSFTYEVFNEKFFNEYKAEMIENKLMKENNITKDKIL